MYLENGIIFYFYTETGRLVKSVDFSHLCCIIRYAKFGWFDMEWPNCNL